MKSTRSLIVIFVALTCCAIAGGQTRQKKPQPKSQPSASQPSAPQPAADQMQREMQNAAPSASHAALAKLAGEYLTAGKFTAAPGAAPMEFGGDAKLSMTLDGRFLVEEDSGSFAGQPMKSFKMLGYNNASKRYEGIWTYTMSTAIMTLNGASTDGGRTISFNASWDDEGGAKRNLQIVMRQIDDDHFVVELTEKSADGKPGPVLTTTYSRKEKPTFGG